MKFVNYRCSACHKHEQEEVYTTGQEIPDQLSGKYCPICGGLLKKWNFKNNSQQWKYMDEREQR